MKRPITFLLTALLSVTMTAETYTIVFNSGNGDSSTATSELTSIVLSATSNCVDKIVTASKI